MEHTKNPETNLTHLTHQISKKGTRLYDGVGYQLFLCISDVKQ